MKRLLLIGVMSLSIGMTVQGAKAPGEFVGAWRMVLLEQQDADGKVHKVDCSGSFVFTRDGHFSVQVMRRDPEPQSHAGSDRYSQGGYEATFGRYEVDARAHTFTIHVEGALVRTLIGKDLPRLYEFSGKQLTVKSAHPDEHWKVVWERY